MPDLYSTEVALLLTGKKKELSRLYAQQTSDYVNEFTKIIWSYDLTDSQYALLQIVNREGKKTCSYLADSLGVTLSAVTNLSNKLVKKGYIERIIPESDRRTTLLQITESGQAIMQKMIDRYTEISEGMWTGFSEEEMELLIASYQKLIANMDREKK